MWHSELINNKNEFIKSTSDRDASWFFYEKIKCYNLMSKSRVFHNAGAAYINDRSKNELAQTLLLTLWFVLAFWIEQSI